MIIFAIDDEKLMLDNLERRIRDAEPEAEVKSFLLASAAISGIENGDALPDVIFCDIEMPGMNGLDFAARVKKMCPRCNIIFVTGFSEYSLEALRQHSSGYILKPVTAEKITEELRELRYPVIERPKHSLQVQCFGSFEMFSNDEPLKFKYRKSKELFAYLVDRRGASQNTAELCSVLWEDAADSPSLRSMFRNIVADLGHVLDANGGSGAFMKSYNKFWVNAHAFDCDLYDYLDKMNATDRIYFGEYMIQYSWAEPTAAYLSEISGIK